MGERLLLALCLTLREPIAGLTFEDPDAGKKSRRYYVVAVVALGQEGSPSSPV